MTTLRSHRRVFCACRAQCRFAANRRLFVPPARRAWLSGPGHEAPPAIKSAVARLPIVPDITERAGARTDRSAAHHPPDERTRAAALSGVLLR